jgi:hypothetical protein
MTPQDKLAIAGAYVAAARAGDTDAITALSEADAIVWHNHDDREVDVATMGRTLRWLHRIVPDIRWDDVAPIGTSDGFVRRALMSGTAPSGWLRAHTCVVATISLSDKIARIDEYLDSAALAPLSGV